MIKKLSILVPAYNEEKTVGKILKKVLVTEFGVPFEIIIINDASTDRTRETIMQIAKDYPKLVTTLEHQTNLGKGAGIKTALSRAKGDYVMIQDADLEYDPEDIARMVRLVNEDHKVIFGSRLIRLPVFTGRRKTPFLLHYFGNRLLSLVMSLLYGQWITDMETCYKLFPKDILSKITLKSKGFEFEPEITAKILKLGYKIKEIEIITKPRGYDEGKKIDTFKDGWRALYAIIKYRFTD